MIWIERPAIEANIGSEPVELDEPLRGVVATLAQTHERTEPKFVDIAAVRLDVIADGCRRDDAALETEFAERVAVCLGSFWRWTSSKRRPSFLWAQR